MIFKICDKCRGTNINTLVPKLKKINSEADISIGCQNFCGIGNNKSFIIIDHTPIIALNEDELIEKIKEHLKK